MHIIPPIKSPSFLTAYNNARCNGWRWTDGGSHSAFASPSHLIHQADREIGWSSVSPLPATFELDQGGSGRREGLWGGGHEQMMSAQAGFAMVMKLCKGGCVKMSARGEGYIENKKALLAAFLCALLPITSSHPNGRVWCA